MQEISAQELASEMGITSENLERRLTFVGYTDDDVKRLSTIQSVIEKNAERLANEFLIYLSHLPEGQSITSNPTLVELVRREKTAHIIAMVNRKFDEAYAWQRLNLAQVYAVAMLETRVFLGAFHHTMEIAGLMVMQAFERDPMAGYKCFMSLKKVCFFDMGLIVDVLVFERERIIRKQQLALTESEKRLRQSQKMEAVGRLAGGIAHDFNNLLTVILGYGNIVKENLNTGDANLQGLNEIIRAGERAATLTGQLLAFSRQQVVEPRVLNLNDLLGGMDGMLKRLVGEDVNYSTIFSGEIRNVKVDVNGLEQVVMNLVINSRDAMPNGGTIVVETANVDLDATYAQSHPGVTAGPHVMLAVSDTGSGMDEATQARLFEPFFTTKEKGRGTGLGLSTTYGIVRQNGGNIWVYSELGRGTTFKIYFPVSDFAAGPPQTVSFPLTKPTTVDERILLVEDDPQVRAVARDILENAGYKVVATENSVEALSLSKSLSERFDLLLTDVVMPLMNGRELARAIVALRPEIKVIYMSGYTQNVIIHHNVLDEGLVLLQKPFTPISLETKVREVLNRISRPTNI